MKNVFVILVLISGFVVSNADAQSCNPANCPPCPPGCCIINCCTSKAAAAAITTDQTMDVMFASFLAEGLKTTKMSRKEMKACIEACKTSGTTAAANCQPTPACQPTTAFKVTTGSAETIPAVYKVSLPKS